MPTMVRIRDALAPLQLGERAVEVGAGEALLGEQGLGLGAAGRVQPVAPARWRMLDDHRPQASLEPAIR